MIYNDPIKISARLVMNNNTLSLFTDEAYTSSLFTLRLSLVSMKVDKYDHCCFVIRSNNRKFEICSLEQSCGIKPNPIFFNNWIIDLELFTNACSDFQRTGNFWQIYQQKKITIMMKLRALYLQII